MKRLVCLCVRWWVGEWQKCSASCGSSGHTKRTVLCIQAISVEEQKALLSSQCEHMPKPESLSTCNTHIPCPAEWTTGSWSKVSPGWNLSIDIKMQIVLYVIRCSYSYCHTFEKGTSVKNVVKLCSNHG